MGVTKSVRPGGKLRIVLLVICAYLLGGLIFSGLAFASEESELYLARGDKLYLDGKYAEARDQLAKAAELDPNNPEIWSLLGTTDLALKDYQAAKEAFTKTVALDPDYPRGKLYLGVANYFLGNYAEAEPLLKEAKAQAPNDGLAHYYLGLANAAMGHHKDALTNLESGMNLSPQFALGFKGYQEAVKSTKPEIRPYSFALTTGFEYDDNVKVLPDNTTVSGRSPNGMSLGQYKGHKADWRTPVILNANYEPLRTDQWTAGVRYYGYTGLNYRLSAFNIVDQFGELYVKYQLNRLTINPFYSFDYTWQGGVPFSMFNSVGMRFTLAETANLTGDLVYLYQNRDFKYFGSQTSNAPGSNAFNRTGYMNQVGLFQTLAGRLGSLRLGLFWQRELTDGINWTANWYRATIEGYLNLPWKILAYSYFEYARTVCSNRDSVAGIFRRDNYYQAIFQLRRPVTSWMNVIAGYNHISNPSNIQDYQYDRNIYQVLVMFYY
ncbi:MAG: tetratricopeptide repeat protein [Syntrophobacterales bacterium]|jgi:tetratricopeptide (TPR) repeat protein|nr:tetratricopeptide repeat protein [Syntrophobacterales bacterium]